MPFFPVVCLLLIEFIDNNWIYWYWFGIFSLQLYFITFFLSCFFSVCCCSYSLLWAFIHYIAMASSSKDPSFLPLHCVCSNPNLIRHGKRLLCLFLLRVFLSPTHSLSFLLFPLFGLVTVTFSQLKCDAINFVWLSFSSLGIVLSLWASDPPKCGNYRIESIVKPTLCTVLSYQFRSGKPPPRRRRRIKCFELLRIIICFRYAK